MSTDRKRPPQPFCGDWLHGLRPQALSPKAPPPQPFTHLAGGEDLGSKPPRLLSFVPDKVQ